MPGCQGGPPDAPQDHPHSPARNELLRWGGTRRRRQALKGGLVSIAIEDIVDVRDYRHAQDAGAGASRRVVRTREAGSPQLQRTLTRRSRARRRSAATPLRARAERAFPPFVALSATPGVAAGTPRQSAGQCDARTMPFALGTTQKNGFRQNVWRTRNLPSGTTLQWASYVGTPSGCLKN